MSRDGDEAIMLAQGMRVLMHGSSLAVQGAVLAQLLAHWLCEHEHEHLDLILETHIASVKRMEINIRMDA